MSFYFPEEYPNSYRSVFFDLLILLDEESVLHGSCKELVLADKMEERQQQRAEAQKDAKEAEQADKPGKAERGEKKPERERVSMKEKLPEKKAEVAKNEASREHPVPSKMKETALG